MAINASSTSFKTHMASGQKSLKKEVVDFNCKRKGKSAFKLGKAIEKLYHKEIMGA